MGDFQGHPFRGNQYTAGGITAKYNPNLRSEARNLGVGKYEVGPKFFDLPDDASRLHVLKHEEGHDLSDEMLQDLSAFKVVDMLGDYPDVNGQTTPGEIVAEAYAVMHSDPQWLRDHHPKLANFMETKIREWRQKKVWAKNPPKQGV